MSPAIEKAIRTIVSSFVEAYATGFSDRHLSEKDDPNGTINMKIHNVFLAALGSDIQYYSALVRSLDSSLGNMLERMAIKIATLNYTVVQYVEGVISTEQTAYIAKLLEEYKSHARRPQVSDYAILRSLYSQATSFPKRHESDYYLYDEETKVHYLIELKMGGDLDNKKARAEKEALLEQYCILANSLDPKVDVRLCFATAYNRYGEGHPWMQQRVRQFFAEDELLISEDFWNMVCKSSDGYSIVLDEYTRNAHYITSELERIKVTYIP